MAIYALDKIRFELDDKRVIASADILKDDDLLQSFSVSLKQTSDGEKLGMAVIDYAKDIIEQHVKSIVLKDTFDADVLDVATTWLERQSWSYG